MHLIIHILVETVILYLIKADHISDIKITDDESSHYEHHVGDSLPNFGEYDGNSVENEQDGKDIIDAKTPNVAEISKWARAKENGNRNREHTVVLDKDDEIDDNYYEMERELREEIAADEEKYEKESRKKRSFFSQNHQGCWGGTSVLRPFSLRRYRDGNHNSLCAWFCTISGYNVASTRGKMCGCSYGMPNPIITTPEVEEYVKICNYTCPGSRAHTLGLSCKFNECCGGSYGYTVTLMSAIDTTKVMLYTIWQEVRERSWSITQVERIQKRSLHDDQEANGETTEENQHHLDTRSTCTLNCGLHGRCIFTGFFQVCKCDAGWSSADCSHQCKRDCSSHGRCFVNKGRQHCECESGFEGDNCEIQNCFKECMNGGSCVTVNEQSLCRCPPKFGSHDCSQECSLDCKFRGHCVIEDFGPICRCPAGRGGKTCADPCTKVCHNDGYCYVENQSQRCLCNSRYAGLSCERATKYDIYCQPFEDEPNLQDARMTCPKDTAIRVISAVFTRHSTTTCTSFCQANAELVNTRRKKRLADGNAQVSPCSECGIGKTDDEESRNITYILSRCEKKPSCEFNWGSEQFNKAFNSKHCPQIFKYVEFEYDCMPNFKWQDPCLAKPCHHKGECFGDKSTQTYTCACRNGWKGTKCSISPFDPCDNYPCVNNGTCIPDKITQTFSCKCAIGYTGSRCDIPPGSVSILVGKPMVLNACFPAAINIDTVCVINEDPLTCWVLREKVSVNGHDHKIINSSLSVDKCKQECIFETTFECVSIEWTSTKCILSSAKKMSVGDHFGFTGDGADYYERVSCTSDMPKSLLTGRRKREESEDSTEVCSPGSERFGEFCYKLSDTTADYETARVQCKVEFGELVSIHSTSQEAHILQMMKDRQLTDMWIGLENPIGSFESWIDNTLVDFSTTKTKEFNSDFEKCVQLQQNVDNNGAATAKWLDNDCSIRLHFMCRMDRQNGAEEVCRRDPRALQRLKRQCDGKRTCNIEPTRVLGAKDTIFSPPMFENEPEVICWETLSGKSFNIGAHKKEVHNVSPDDCKRACENEKGFTCKAITYHKGSVPPRCGLDDGTRNTNPEKFAANSGTVYYGRIPCPVCYEEYKGIKILKRDEQTLGEDEFLTYREEFEGQAVADCLWRCRNERRCMSFEFDRANEMCVIQGVNRQSAEFRFANTSVEEYAYYERANCQKIKIHYSCTNNYVYTACNEDRIEAACTSGYIQVDEAWYGRIDSNVCPTSDLQSATCLRTITERLKNYCDNERSCSIDLKELDVAWMDPCIGIEKYLVVKHSCQPVDMCPDNYTYNSLTLSCYKIDNKQYVPWHIAKDNCEQDGKDLANSVIRSHLVSMVSEMEHNIIFSMIQALVDPSENNRFWIGLHDENHERRSSRKHWEWWNGEPYNNQWNKWYDKDSPLSQEMPARNNEPNGGDNFDHVWIESIYNGQWFNAENTKSIKAYYICEYKPYSQPCTRGYFYSDDTRSCYKIYVEEMTFKESLALCYQEQAYLTSILNLREQTFIQDLINQAHGSMSGGQYWIGRYQNTWVDKSRFKWSNWYVNGTSKIIQPSEPDGTGNNAYIDMLFGGQWFDSNGLGKAGRICKMRPPYVVKIKLTTLVANDKNELSWKQCIMEEKQNSVVIDFCTNIDDAPEDKTSMMHLKLVSGLRELQFKSGRNMKPLGKYDFMMENPSLNMQLLMRHYMIEMGFEESLFVESGHSVASTLSQAMTTTVKTGLKMDKQTTFSISAGINVFGFQFGLSFNAAWASSTDQAYSYTASWAKSKKMSTFFNSRQSSTTKVVATEKFGVVLKVAPKSIAQINLFTETYPLVIKWRSMFYMEGTLEITWRIFGNLVTRKVDIVQILINEARKMYAVGMSKVGNRARIVAMLTTRGFDGSYPKGESRQLNGDEIEEDSGRMFTQK